MRLIFPLLVLFLPFQIYAAAQVAPTLTEIELSGIIGENDVLENRKYRILAKLKDQDELYPDNSESLGHIEAVVGSVELEFPESFRKLKRVRLESIGIYYIQQFGKHEEKTRIEIYIPHGNYDFCENHDNHSKHYLQNRAVFSFNSIGRFIEERTWERCKHY